ncbi:TPA: hypothetical protein IGZ65_005043 [Escherichia coli]|nr:hypothetical protein [Escherichia coli]
MFTSSNWQPLHGKDALNHLIFSRTGLMPDQTEKLSFADILLILHEDLVRLHIPQASMDLPDYVKSRSDYEIHSQNSYLTELPPCSEDEWDLTLSEKFQEQRKHF